MGIFSVDPRPASFRSGYQELFCVIIACMSQLLNQAGSLQAMPQMNILGDAFSNTTQTDKVWFMASFPLTAGAFILISGKFGDLYGLKKVFLMGTAWGCIWVLITGLTSYADSVIFFCFARAMHGVGLAFMLPNMTGIIGNMYPNGQRKAFVFCMMGGMAPSGATAGSVFGALTAQFGHWEWAYYANAICLAFLGIGAYFVLPDVPRHAAPEVTMDWYGSITGVVGLVLFNFAWNQAPQSGWDTSYIIVLLILGVVFLCAFFYIEKKTKYPLLPQEVMNPHTGLILAVVFFGWASFSIYTFYYWSFLLNFDNYTPLKGAATYGTFLVFGTVAAFLVSVLIRRIRPSYLMFAATAGFLIGITMLANVPVGQTYFQMMFPLMIILSFGMDISFPASSLILSDNLPKKHQGMASSLVSTMVNYSISVSLGFAGTAEAQILKHTNNNTLKGYHAAMYVGVGLAGIGCLLAIVLHIMSHIWEAHKTDEEEQGEEQNHVSDSSENKEHIDDDDRDSRE